MLSLNSQNYFTMPKKTRRNDVSFNGYMQDEKPVVEVGLNGFGRITKTILREWAATNLDVPLAKQNLTTDRFLSRISEEPAGIDIKTINIGRKTTEENLISYFKYDNEMGNFLGDVIAERDQNGAMWLKIGKKGSKDLAKIRIFEQRDAKEIPLKDFNVDVVVDATGNFLTKEKLNDHIKAGAARAIVSAPAKDDMATFVPGINNNKLTGEIVHSSAASCTTTASVGPIKLLNETYGVEDGFLTTTHGVTGTQVTVDKFPAEGSSDLGKTRGAFNSLIPSTTGAAKTAGKIVDGLNGKLDGLSVRVPNSNVSFVTMVLDLKQNVTEAEVKDLFRKAYKSDKYKDILAGVDKGVTTVDMSGRHESSLVLTDDIKVINGKKVVITAFYDNEWGFTRSLMDHIKNVGAKLYETNPERFRQEKKTLDAVV